jgi:hypothetical protein
LGQAPGRWVQRLSHGARRRQNAFPVSSKNWSRPTSTNVSFVTNWSALTTHQKRFRPEIVGLSLSLIGAHSNRFSDLLFLGPNPDKHFKLIKRQNPNTPSIELFLPSRPQYSQQYSVGTREGVGVGFGGGFGVGLGVGFGVGFGFGMLVLVFLLVLVLGVVALSAGTPSLSMVRQSPMLVPVLAPVLLFT